MTGAVAVRPGAPPEQGTGQWIWGAVWRTLVALLVGMMMVGGLAWQEEIGERAVQPAPLALVDVLLGTIALVLMHLRRKAPVTVAVLLASFMMLSNLSVGAASIAIVSLATSRRWVPIAIVGFIHVAGYAVYNLVNPYLNDELLNFVIDVGVGGVMSAVMLVVIGAYIGLRRDHVRSLVERADTAEREQASRVAQAQANERARIAREMHDVLAHRISLVTMHAGALAYRDNLSREEVASAAETIRDSAHTALTELREVLGVLRDLPGGTSAAGHEGDDVHRPQPTLGDLAALLDENRRAGSTITLHDDRAGGDDRVGEGSRVGDGVRERGRAGEAEVDAVGEDARGEDGGLAEGVSRTAFRVIQEGLTNARKHAPGQPVVVTLAGAPGDGLTIAVANPSGRSASERLPASGLGLMGLAERAELSGGRLRYGEQGGRFVVRAWLPWSV